MARQNYHRPASASPSALAGFWRLAPSQAMALAPRVDGALRVASGSAWATWDGEWGASPGDSGDFWLREGDELPVPGGRRLVLEAFGSELRFSWDPVAAPRGALSRVKRALGARA